ncbi:MAG: hypothetical protein ACREBR_01120, partial [bacterium]
MAEVESNIWVLFKSRLTMRGSVGKQGPQLKSEHCESSHLVSRYLNRALVKHCRNEKYYLDLL